MTPGEDDYDAEMAHWLEDSGRRRAPSAGEPPAELLALLESTVGRKLATREDILAYVAELKSRETEWQRAAAKRALVREAAFLALLAMAAAQYYFFKVGLQIERLHTNHYFTPQKAPAQRI